MQSDRTGLFLLLALGAAGCGGTEETARPEADAEAELVPLVDTGSAPADCTAEDGYDVLPIEDWETGAGTGWYSNNEYCRPCTDLQDLLDDVLRPAACLAQEANSETGCDPSAVGEEGDAALRDLRDSLRTFLPNEDPDEEALRTLAGELGRCDELNDEVCEGGELLQALIPKLREAFEETVRLQTELAECRVACDPTQTPAAMAKPFPGEAIPGGRCGSTTGAHVRLNRRVNREGTLGRQFSPTGPLDASAYEGVSFWARSVPGARTTFRISVPEIATDEKALDGNGEPPCRFINPKELTDDACDKFGRYFQMTSDWQFFTVPFSEMRQNGFGKQAPFFDIGNLMGIAFEYKQGRWDYWVDDVGFYRKK